MQSADKEIIMEITGFIRVRSVLVVPGDKINGICLRHEDSAFVGRTITISDVVEVQFINSNSRLVRTVSGDLYLIFED